MRTVADWIFQAADASRQGGRLAALDGAIAEARHALAIGRRGLAAAIAEGRREGARLAQFEIRIADLETRAVMALRAGRADLAEAAADTIAVLETELVAAREVARRLAQDVAHLRATSERQRSRLAELDRGRRQTKVNAALAWIGAQESGGGAARAQVLLDAVEHETACENALAELDDGGDRLRDRLAEAGFGAPARALPSSVMRRLEAKAACLPKPEGIARSDLGRDDRGNVVADSDGESAHAVR